MMVELNDAQLAGQITSGVYRPPLRMTADLHPEQQLVLIQHRQPDRY